MGVKAWMAAGVAAVLCTYASSGSATIYTPTVEDVKFTYVPADYRFPPGTVFQVDTVFSIPDITLRPGDELLVNLSLPQVATIVNSTTVPVIKHGNWGQESVFELNGVPGKAYWELGGRFYYECVFDHVYTCSGLELDVRIQDYGAEPGFQIQETVGGTFDINTGLEIPEPGTWILMLLGIATIGAAMRLSRRKNETALASA